ncbi:MAG: hypothetical protein A2X46_09290 [Lentisphaerae bacterium GWF2_57_35]|nr:MAG: hypothetical protein A2X46_09290 [Lentisphaerae bacterium GWF2_57_35]
MNFKAWMLAGVALVALSGFISVGRCATIFQDDVESGTNGWMVQAQGSTTSLLWHIMERDARSPSHSWWCGVESSGTYEDGTNVVDGTLSSPDIVLGSTQAVFFFSERYETESCVDDVQVWLSTNQGASWQALAQNRWGRSAGWTRHVVELGDYTNHTIRLRFRFSANSYMNRYGGWFVDDIEVAEKTDEDQDGLFDFEEGWYGSNSWETDTDLDSVPDGLEVYVAGTDPDDPASCLQWSAMGWATNGVAGLVWQGSPSKLYWLEASPHITGVWSAVSGVVTADVMNPNGMTNLTPSESLFYRVATTDRVALATMGFGCDANGRSALYTNAFVVWGDLHSHTIYSDDAEKRQTNYVVPSIPSAALSNTIGLLDFVSITDHAESNIPGFYTMEKWTNMIAQIMAFQNTHPEIVVFPGFEYTKTWFSMPPLWLIPDGNGHKNIILYDFEHLPVRGYGQDAFSSPTQLWAYLDSSNAAGHYLCIPHHPAKGSEPAEEGETHDPYISMGTDWATNYLRSDILDLVEIYSRHGGSEMEDAEEPVHNFRAPGAVNTALDRWLLADHNPAYKMGIIGSTDTHGGNPGDVREISTNVQSWLGPYTGGLAALLVANRTRESFWYALKSKNCYGTSGGRIAIEFTAKLGDALAPMGGTLYHATDLSSNGVGLVNLHIRAVGESVTNPIARIQFYRNSVCILNATNSLWGQTVHIDHIDRLPHHFAYYRAKIWEAASTLNSSCQYERAWSSPIWVEKQ